MFITQKERDSRLRSSDEVLERFGQKAEEAKQPQKPTESTPEPEKKSAPKKDVESHKKTRTLTDFQQAERNKEVRNEKQALQTLEGKATVGAVANVFGPVVAERMFGLTKKQVERIQSATITRDYVEQTDEELKKAIQEQTNDIRNLAYDKLVAVLGCITPEKIQELATKDTKDIAFVGEKLAKIFERMLAKHDQAAPQHVHFHIMKPETKSIDKYPVITVGKPHEESNVDSGSI